MLARFFAFGSSSSSTVASAFDVALASTFWRFAGRTCSSESGDRELMEDREVARVRELAMVVTDRGPCDAARDVMLVVAILVLLLRAICVKEGMSTSSQSPESNRGDRRDCPQSGARRIARDRDKYDSNFERTSPWRTQQSRPCVPTIPQIQGLRGFEACASPFSGRNGSSKAIVFIAQSSTSSLASVVRSHTMVSTVVHGLVHWY